MRGLSSTKSRGFEHVMLYYLLTPTGTHIWVPCAHANIDTHFNHSALHTTLHTRTLTLMPAAPSQRWRNCVQLYGNWYLWGRVGLEQLSGKTCLFFFFFGKTQRDKKGRLSHLAQQRETDIAVIKESEGRKIWGSSGPNRETRKVTDRKQKTEAHTDQEGGGRMEVYVWRKGGCVCFRIYCFTLNCCINLCLLLWKHPKNVKCESEGVASVMYYCLLIWALCFSLCWNGHSSIY